MFNYDFFVLIFIVYVQGVYSKLPNYVRLHTLEDIIETNYVVLNKLNLCNDSQNVSSSLLIAIKTAPVNRDQRDIVRQTWLVDVIEHQIPYIFVLGSTTDGKLLDELLLEDILHNDLLIGKPVDNYYNLTLKGMFLLTWAKTYCSNHWLLYVDDDVIVNVQRTIDFVVSMKHVSEHVFYGQISRFPVNRNTKSKWFVSKLIWKSDRFPDYCHGCGYLIPPNVLPLLHETVTNNYIEPKLWLDDVFITGFATKVANIKLIDSPFNCYNLIGLKLFKNNLVLGEMGKGLQLLRKWERMRGKSTPHIYMWPESVMPMRKISRFNRSGYLMTTNIHSIRKLYKFTIDKGYSSLINGSFYVEIMIVIVVVILLYKRFVWLL